MRVRLRVGLSESKRPSKSSVESLVRRKACLSLASAMRMIELCLVDGRRLRLIIVASEGEWGGTTVRGG